MKTQPLPVPIQFRNYWFSLVACVLSVVIILGSLLVEKVAIVQAADADIGYRDFSYSGASAPTAEKPQSKLWFNDGIWWGSLFNSSTGKYEIYRLDWNTHTWTTTGVLIDSRNFVRTDCLWDGSHLYIASAVRPGTSSTDLAPRVRRFSYNTSTKSYSLDTDFPVTLKGADGNPLNTALDALVIDKDTTGKLWATYTLGTSLYVAHTITSDTSWGAAFVPPVKGASNLVVSSTTADGEESAVVAYNGKIGVMWSNHNDDIMYFISHNDGDPDTVWSQNPALQGPKYADDHLNLKSLQADASGQVFAAVKTSLNDVPGQAPGAPLIMLLVLRNDATWVPRTFSTVQYDQTRPIVLIDNQNRKLYMFAAGPCCSGGTIYYKETSLDNPNFDDGPGTPFIRTSLDTINNPTSTKQPLSTASGLVVLAASDKTKYYVHNQIALGPNTTGTSTPTNTAEPTSTPTNTAEPTATSTATPTSTPTNTAEPTATSTAPPTSTPTNTAEPTATSTAPPTSTPAGDLFNDGFESGNFSAWSLVKTGGDGTSAVQNSIVKTGSFAARLSATTATGSYAYIRQALGTAQTDVTVTGDFQLLAEGVSGANVPFFRLLDPSGTRLISLYRQNLSGNKLYIQINGTNYSTTGFLPLNTWAQLSVHVVTAGTGASTVQVYLDGAQIYGTSTASLGSTGVLNVQVGNDTAKQAFTYIADNFSITR